MPLQSSLHLDTIYVGRRSGKILRAVLHRGNGDAVGRRYVGARAVAAAIRELPQ